MSECNLVVVNEANNSSSFIFILTIVIQTVLQTCNKKICWDLTEDVYGFNSVCDVFVCCRGGEAAARQQHTSTAIQEDSLGQHRQHPQSSPAL